MRSAARGRYAAAVVGLGALLLLMAAAAPARPVSGSRLSRLALAQRLQRASERAAGTRHGRIVADTFGYGVHGIAITRDATLRSVHRRYPHLVREVRRGVWRISRPLFVARGATLRIAAPGVREVRLASTGFHMASLVARDAHISFRGREEHRLLVHSWDPHLRAPDSYLPDGRATIAARHRSRLDARHAVFAGLGFYKGTVSGFALWARGQE